LNQHLEIEYKNLLTKKEYGTLKNFFKVEDKQIKKQVNHYFDTASFSLKNLHCALRIREKGNHYEMTLKQPAKIGLLETNQVLQKHEADQALSENKLPDGPIKHELEIMKVPIAEIEYFGSLTTNRVELMYKEGLIVLDFSQYLNAYDYEIEYEVTDSEKGKQIFFELLTGLNIPLRKTENKVQRFYKQKYQQT
jgi:uncharacterized protein YjbK